MKIRMETIKQNKGIIGWHYVNDIAIQTVDTFGRVKTLTDREYHGCKETDKGTCLVVVTRSDDLTNHIYPKDTWARFTPEIDG